MRSKIDYLSWNIPTPKLPAEATDAVQQYVIERLFVGGLEPAWDALSKLTWTLHPGRGFYRWRGTAEEAGVSIFWGDTNNHVHVEFGGQACDWLRDLGVFDEVCKLVQNMVSRVDVATDFLTDVSPSTFVNSMKSERFKSRSSIHSPSGETEYVGSRGSELMARVYRYAPPHPRADLLRVEIEIKSSRAREALLVYLAEGLQGLTAAANHPFQWQHEVWLEQSLAEGAPLAGRRERAASSRVRWLHTQVLPAMKALQSSGQFDVAAWLSSEVVPALLEAPQKRGNG